MRTQQDQLLLLLYLVATPCMAQLSGCDVVNCPTDQFREVHCTVANTTSSAIGIASLNTTISPAGPLTWTVGLSTSPGANISTPSAYDRNYFLGTPPSLDIANPTFNSCGLFFEGIAPHLTFPGSNDSDTSIGTCANAMTPLCVDDLLAQAKAILLDVTTGPMKVNSTAVCVALSANMTNNAPSSCKVATEGKWGLVLARGRHSPLVP